MPYGKIYPTISLALDLKCCGRLFCQNFYILQFSLEYIEQYDKLESPQAQNISQTHFFPRVLKLYWLIKSVETHLLILVLQTCPKISIDVSSQFRYHAQKPQIIRSVSSTLNAPKRLIQSSITI